MSAEINVNELTVNELIVTELIVTVHHQTNPGEATTFTFPLKPKKGQELSLEPNKEPYFEWFFEQGWLIINQMQPVGEGYHDINTSTLCFPSYRVIEVIINKKTN